MVDSVLVLAKHSEESLLNPLSALLEANSLVVSSPELFMLGSVSLTVEESFNLSRSISSSYSLRCLRPALPCFKACSIPKELPGALCHYILTQTDEISH